MRVLCCGSRDFKNVRMVVDRLYKLPKDSTIIEGDAPGADRLCRLTALQIGLNVESYPAEWDKHGKRAGMYRNTDMLYKDIDLVLAFRSRLNSRGTNDTLYKAKMMGIPAEIFDDF